MQIYEGHYRALEKEFLSLISPLSAGAEKITIIAAGAGQLNRLRKLILSESKLSVVGGIRFLPGIQYLEKEMSPLPFSTKKVSYADRTVFALKAMAVIPEEKPLYNLRANVETANSMGAFFETLFEQGISPKIYKDVTFSLTDGPSETEEVIGRVFAEYAKSRAKVYHQCGDMMEYMDLDYALSGTVIFYGFYDLNPGQRRFIRKLAAKTSNIFWFSPIHENSLWTDIYKRTKKLLGVTGKRCDAEIPLNKFGEYFESLQNKKSPPIPDDFRITASSGEMGACRDALSVIAEMHSRKIPYNRIAVVRRKEGFGSLVQMAHHEDIPVKEPLRTKASKLPAANFLSLLVNLKSGQFHYLLLEELLSTGLLNETMDFPASQVSELISDCGVRFGIDNWRDWYASADPDDKLRKLLEKLEGFFATLPSSAYPHEFLKRLQELFSELYRFEISEEFTKILFNRELWLAEENVNWNQFAALLQIQLREQDVELKSGDKDGFHILTIEKIRGSEFDAVIIMDIEEGIYPKPVVEDPRLTEELRSKLEMSRKTDREKEDGFLLRQAGESALNSLDIIYRQRDAKGAEIYPSVLIYDVVSDLGPVKWFKVSSSSPYRQLLGGAHGLHKTVERIKNNELPESPFFTRGFNASKSRMDYSSDFDEYDGMLEEDIFHCSEYSATMLGGYIKCPFAFLAGRIWKLKKKETAGISTTPTPLKKGIFVHDAVEEIIEKYNFDADKKQIREVLESLAIKEEIAKKIGSKELKDVFIEEQEIIIFETLQRHRNSSWKFFKKEDELKGKIGNIDIKGRVDLILENDKSELIIIDLKTGKLPKNKSTEDGNEFQLPFYYQLVTQAYPGRKIEGVYYMAVSAREPGRLEGFSEPEILGILSDTFKSNIEEIIKLLNNGVFPPIPRATGSHPCTYCDYRALCRRIPYERLKSKAEVSISAEFLAKKISKKDGKW